MDSRYPAHLAPSETLLAEVNAQKGTQIEIKHEKESDLFYFKPQKKQTPSPQTTGIGTRKGFFLRNNNQNKISELDTEVNQIKPKHINP